MRRFFYLAVLILVGTSGCIPTGSTPISEASRPTLELIAPPSGTRVAQGNEVEIESRSSDARGIERVELWVDEGIYRVDDASAQPNFHLVQRWRADTLGTHRLAVVAFNVDGQASQQASISIEVVDAAQVTATPVEAPTLTPAPEPTPRTPAPEPTGTPTSEPASTPTLTSVPTLTSTPPSDSTTPTWTLTVTVTLTPTTPTATVQPSGSGQMILIPAGRFTMGSNDDHVNQATTWCQCGRDRFEDEFYMHEVYLDAYWIDKFEVTNRQFAAFAQATGYRTDAEKKNEVNTWRTAATSGREEHPVVWMSWNDANAYCQWAGKRLPTEAEWEKAARGTDARLWPWGNDWDAGRLNMAEGARGTTTPVGSFPKGASPYEVMDMAGNTWEWVGDWYGYTFYQGGTNRDQNPRGPESGEDRVLRGGGFNNAIYDVRTPNRHKGGVTGYAPDHGFRCARSAN